jgi:flagellin
MAQVINTNIMSLTAQRNLNATKSDMATSMERLSSGLRINSAKDDAAGLAISERFTSQIRGLDQAVRNSNDGISLAQTAEGALQETGNILQRVRELAVQSANDTNSESDRRALNNEVKELVSEVNRIANNTEFNGAGVLDGSLEELVFQVGANQGQTIEVNGVDARARNLGMRQESGDTITSTNLTSALTADDLAVNGYTVDLSGISSADQTAALDEVVDRISAEYADTGVQAERTQGTTQGLTYTANTAEQTVTINDVDVDIAGGATAEQAANAINSKAGQTGVSAYESGGSVVLESDGVDIEFTDGATNGGADILGGDNTYSRGINLISAPGEDITHSGDAATSLQLSVGGEEDFRVSGTDVLSRDSANDAIKTMDQAIQMVNDFRSELGATQNRFESTISNLEVTSENLSAARSRIQDADFAKETSEMTRTQILQQAGTSMLAQANQVPQNALSLLQ